MYKVYIICVQINDGYVSTDVLYRYVMNFYGAVPNTKRKLLSRTVSKVIDICTKKGTVNDDVRFVTDNCLGQMIFDQQNYNIYNINYYGDIIDYKLYISHLKTFIY